MPFTTYRGEKSAGEIVDKMFVRLTNRQREIAVAALVKANPQLKKPKDVADGAILRVPDVPELRAKTRRDLENPDAQVAKDVAEALAGYNERLSARFKADQAATKAATSLLGSRSFKAAIANVPHLLELAEKAGATLNERAEGRGERQKTALDAIDKLREDLDANFK